MKSTKTQQHIDPVVLGRRAHARVIDTPVNVSSDDKENELLKRILQRFIFDGDPAGFRKWLRHHNQKWRTSAQAQYCMGVSFKADRQYGKAEKCYKSALKLWQALENKRKISFVLSELSVIALTKNDYQTAWLYLDQAMQIFPNLFGIHYNRLALASSQQDLDKLREVYKQMNHLCKNWYRDPNTKFLFTDIELEFLRKKAPDLWQKIGKKVEIHRKEA